MQRQVSTELKEDVTRDDWQRRFLAQHSVATLLRRCFEWLQNCSNIAALCCAKNRRCESSSERRTTETVVKKWKRHFVCILTRISTCYI